MRLGPESSVDPEWIRSIRIESSWEETLLQCGQDLSRIGGRVPKVPSCTLDSADRPLVLSAFYGG